MICKSKITIINKKIPEVEVITYRNGKQEKRKEPNYDIKIGERINCLSENVYCYRDGSFFIVKDKKGIIHFIDSEDIEFIFENLL